MDAQGKERKQGSIVRKDKEKGRLETLLRQWRPMVARCRKNSNTVEYRETQRVRLLQGVGDGTATEAEDSNTKRVRI